MLALNTLSQNLYRVSCSEVNIKHMHNTQSNSRLVNNNNSNFTLVQREKKLNDALEKEKQGPRNRTKNELSHKGKEKM